MKLEIMNERPTDQPTYMVGTEFPIRDACFSKFKNIPDLLSDDKKVK